MTTSVRAAGKKQSSRRTYQTQTGNVPRLFTSHLVGRNLKESREKSHEKARLVSQPLLSFRTVAFHVSRHKSVSILSRFVFPAIGFFCLTTHTIQIRLNLISLCLSSDRIFLSHVSHNTNPSHSLLVSSRQRSRFLTSCFVGIPTCRGKSWNLPQRRLPQARKNRCAR